MPRELGGGTHLAGGFVQGGDRPAAGRGGVFPVWGTLGGLGTPPEGRRTPWTRDWAVREGRRRWWGGPFQPSPLRPAQSPGVPGKRPRRSAVPGSLPRHRATGIRPFPGGVVGKREGEEAPRRTGRHGHPPTPRTQRTPRGQTTRFRAGLARKVGPARLPPPGGPPPPFRGRAEPPHPSPLGSARKTPRFPPRPLTMWLNLLLLLF